MATSLIHTTTLDVQGNFISHRGEVLSSPEVNMPNLSPEMTRFIGQKYFNTEMSRIMTELAKTDGLVIPMNTLTVDQNGNYISLKRTEEKFDVFSLGGIASINLYTQILPIKSNILENLGQKYLDLQNEVLTSKRS